MAGRMTRERYLSDDELARLMAAVRTRRHPNQARDYALLAILANTGIRPEEARALRRRDVIPGGRPPRIHLSRVKLSHGPYPVNTLPIHKAVARVLSTYLATMKATAPDALLFPFTKRQSRRIFHYYTAKAGLSRTLRLYSLRHAVGMRLWRFTRDVRLIHGVMGHIRLKAAHAYQHTSQEQVRDAFTAVGTAGVAT